MENNWYVYRHRRLDNFSVFYIGISGVENNFRAYTKHSRSIHWNNIVNKAGYQVEIIAKNLSEKEACELEIFLITTYGRSDENKGKLVNLTQGGEGSSGYIKTKDWCEKHSEHLKIKYSGEGNPFFGKNHSEDVKNYISNIQKIFYTYKEGSWSNITIKKYNDSVKNSRSKKVINIDNGILFNSLREASEYYNVNYSAMKGRMLGDKMYSGNLWYLDIYENINKSAVDVINFLEKEMVLNKNIK